MTNFGNPVPLGRAGTGDAVVFGEGLGGLRYLQHTDALRQAQQARAAQQAATRQQQDYRDFMSRVRLSDKGGVHYLPLLQNQAQQTYQQMEAAATNAKLNRYDRGLQVQMLQDQYNRMAAASEKNDAYVGDLARRVTADKRYDTDKTTQLLHNTLYKDGQVVSPLDWDPQAAEAAVATGHEHLNGVEVFKTYLRGTHPDAVTSAREALPGGRGYRNVASSDVYELTPDGKIRYDLRTNLPVVKATPQALNYFDSDPVNRQYLDGFERQHQQQLAGIVEKMRRYEPLTPAENDVLRTEQSPTGRRMELFKRGLMEQGYGRSSETTLVKAAPRPRVGSSGAGKAPKFTQSGGTEFTPGVLGGVGLDGTQGVAHFGQGTLLRRTLASGEVKPYVANALHHDYTLLTGDGKPGQHITNNGAPQELSYEAPLVVARQPNGRLVFPNDPAIITAAQNGDKAPLEAWLKQERAKDPSLKPAYSVLALPAKRADLQVGSAEEVFQQLKAKEDDFRKAYSGGEEGLSGALSDPSQTPEDRQRTQLALQLFKSNKQPPRFYSDTELREQARKLYANKDASLLIPYSGTEKLTVDANTGYALRQPATARRMADYLAGIDSRTRPAASATQPAAPGRGPLAGMLPTAPRAAPATIAAPPVPANPHGFKFKKVK